MEILFSPNHCKYYSKATHTFVLIKSWIFKMNHRQNDKVFVFFRSCLGIFSCSIFLCGLFHAWTEIKHAEIRLRLPACWAECIAGKLLAGLLLGENLKFGLDEWFGRHCVKRGFYCGWSCPVCIKLLSDVWSVKRDKSLCVFRDKLSTYTLPHTLNCVAL